MILHSVIVVELPLKDVLCFGRRASARNIRNPMFERGKRDFDILLSLDSGSSTDRYHVTRPYHVPVEGQAYKRCGPAGSHRLYGHHRVLATVYDLRYIFYLKI